EALATGDANFRAKSQQRILELREQAGTVFLVAHNLAEIEASCNRVIWLEKGELMMQGYDVPAIVDAYLKATGGEPRKREKQPDQHSELARDRRGELAGRRAQPQAQGRAAGRPRTRGHLTVLGLGQPAHDEQADAYAAEPPAVTGLALEEPVEDALVVAFGDADALVLDGDLDPSLADRGPDGDRAAVGRVLDGVLEQLPDDDVGGHRVAAGGRQVIGDIGHDNVLVGQRLERGGRAAQHRAEVEGALADRKLVGARARAEQQLLHQPAQGAGPFRDRLRRGAPLAVGELVPAAGQRAGEALHHGDRRAQLVAGRGQEQVLRLLEFLGRGHVAEVDHELAAVGERGAEHVEPPSVRQLVGSGRAGRGQRERRRLADGVLGGYPGDPVGGGIPLA